MTGDSRMLIKKSCITLNRDDFALEEIKMDNAT